MLMLANKLKKVKSNQSRFGLKPFSLVTLDYQWKNLYITIGWLGLSTKFVMKMQGYKKSSLKSLLTSIFKGRIFFITRAYILCRDIDVDAKEARERGHMSF